MLLIYATFPNQEEAKTICHGLVKEKIAACAHISTKGLSIYEWEGTINADPECIAFIKLKNENYRRAEDFIKSKHSYDTPCIIAFKTEKALNEYAQWVNSN